MTKKSFKKLGEVGEVSVLMQLEQPANFRDLEGLDGAGVDLVQLVLYFMPKTGVEIHWGGLYPTNTLN